MRGTVAKKIRKAVYGDMSTRETKYVEEKSGSAGRTTVHSVGLRSKYREVKKAVR